MAEANPLLSADEIGRRLKAMPDWSIVQAPAAQELRRTYSFGSFAKAIAFMHAAVPRIDALNHHPRWENVYDKLTVALTTHDAGSAVTARDFELAATLDQLYDMTAA